MPKYIVTHRYTLTFVERYRLDAKDAEDATEHVNHELMTGDLSPENACDNIEPVDNDSDLVDETYEAELA